MNYTVEQITSSIGIREIHYPSLLHSLGVVKGNPFVGALAYTGCSKVAKNGDAYRFQLNGRKGVKWYAYIVLNGSDLYDIVLLEERRTHSVILGQQGDVYFDELQRSFEGLYDTAIKEHNEGIVYVG